MKNQTAWLIVGIGLASSVVVGAGAGLIARDFNRKAEIAKFNEQSKTIDDLTRRLEVATEQMTALGQLQRNEITALDANTERTKTISAYMKELHLNFQMASGLTEKKESSDKASRFTKLPAEDRY